MTAPITSREELLACPFCGTTPAVDDDRDGVCSVFCANNDCIGVEVTCPDLADATEFWNTRAPQPSAPAQGKRTDLPRPSDIAAKIVDWFPQKAFMYDTYVKLKSDIASAIRIERERSPLPSTGLPAPAPHAEVREALGLHIVRDAIIEKCARIALSIDSGRGNEKEIAKAIRALALPQSTDGGGK